MTIYFSGGSFTTLNGAAYVNFTRYLKMLVIHHDQLEVEQLAADMDGLASLENR